MFHLSFKHYLVIISNLNILEPIRFYHCVRIFRKEVSECSFVPSSWFELVTKKWPFNSKSHFPIKLQEATRLLIGNTALHQIDIKCFHCSSLLNARGSQPFLALGVEFYSRYQERSIIQLVFKFPISVLMSHFLKIEFICFWKLVHVLIEIMCNRLKVEFTCSIHGKIHLR